MEAKEFHPLQKDRRESAFPMQVLEKSCPLSRPLSSAEHLGGQSAFAPQPKAEESSGIPFSNQTHPGKTACPEVLQEAGLPYGNSISESQMEGTLAS